MLRKVINKSERGQAIIIIAFAMVGLVAIVGLMTDGGIMLIEYAKLKRGLDAGAIAAAAQFRKDFTGEDLANAAQEFLILNDSEAQSIIIYRCKRDYETNALDTTVDGTEHDDTLCTTPRRKLVRVEAVRLVVFGFLRVIGINSSSVQATAVGEAASVDLVLVLDNSPSMAFETDPDGDPLFADPGDDPVVCNAADNCMPFKRVKDAALELVDRMFFPYDRVAVVTYTDQPPYTSRTASDVAQELTADQSDVVDAIAQLKTFQPPDCPYNGLCLDRSPGYYDGLDCFEDNFVAFGDPTACTGSDVGSALLRAAIEFSRMPVRTDSFWAVLILMGGPANAGKLDNDPSTPTACPSATWFSAPLCRDSDIPTITRHTNTSPSYDADDWARDNADYVANPVTGQGATIFSICLGEYCRNYPYGLSDSAENLAEYMALTAGDESGVDVNHGNYYYAPDSAGLSQIFLDIAANILTRLSK
ncbi:MAG: VWA domain-containing protein [Anaerolineales bacterium]|nr:VWA domain-containing protein [Anaerolineales bacterium]